jgi:hypothetical protein
MSQNSLVIGDGTGAQVLSAMNGALDTLKTCFSGPTAPGTPSAFQLWADTTNGVLKQRDSSNTAWIPLELLTGVGANVVKTVTGGSYTLTEAEGLAASFEFNGTLTSNMIVIVPNNMPVFAVENLTTGAFTLTVKTAAGTGQVIAQGEISMLYCNGANCEFISDTQGTAPKRGTYSAVRATAVQTMTAGAWSQIILNSAMVNTNGSAFVSHNIATGLFTVLQSGQYEISAVLTAVNPTAAYNAFNAAIAINGAVAHYLGSGYSWAAVATLKITVSGQTTRYLPAGTTVALWGNPNVAMNADFWGSGWGIGGCQLELVYMG